MTNNYKNFKIPGFANTIIGFLLVTSILASCVGAMLPIPGGDSGFGNRVDPIQPLGAESAKISPIMAETPPQKQIHTPTGTLSVAPGAPKMLLQPRALSGNPQSPTNDSIETPTMIVLDSYDYYTIQSNSNATPSGNDPVFEKDICIFGGGDDTTGFHTIWFALDAPTSGTVTTDTTGSEYDTLLGVWTQDGQGNLTLVGCNDDKSGIGVTSLVTFTATQGQRYYIEVAGNKINDFGDTFFSAYYPGLSATRTATEEWTPTVTETPTPSNTPTITLTPTETPTPSLTPTETLTSTITPIIPCYSLTTGVNPLLSGSVTVVTQPNCPSDPTKYLENTDVNVTASEGSELGPVQWPSSATASSSYPGTSPAAATGAADVTTCAWSSKAWGPNSKLAGSHWIMFTYPIAGKISQVSIHETYSPGSVTMIEFIEPSGVLHRVWQGTDTTPCNRWFTPTLTTTTYDVKRVRVWVQKAGLKQIDTVQITNAANPYGFQKWEDGSTNRIRTVTMTGSKSISAIYYLPPCFTLTTSVSPTNSGGSIGVLTPPNCRSAPNKYRENTIINLSASAGGESAYDQWAASAIASSSYPGTSPAAATGVSDVTTCAWSPKAWAPNSRLAGSHWIMFTYAVARKVSQVSIHETYSPGPVTRIDFIEPSGISHNVWQGTDPTPCNRWFTPSIPTTTYLVQKVRVWVQKAGLKQIDAVKITNAANPYFYNWEDGSTNRSRSLIITSNTSVRANYSGVAPTATPVPTQTPLPAPIGIYENSSPYITFSGAWTQYENVNYSGGNTKYSSATGNMASLYFTGQGIDLLYNKYPGSGILRIQIDGATITDLNQASGAGSYQNRWISPVLSPGNHWIILTHLSGSYTDIDALEVKAAPTATPLPTNTPEPVTPNIYDDLDTNLVFIGSWSRYLNSSSYEGGSKHSSVVGSSATIYFTGQGVDLIYPKYTGVGVVRIDIDGTTVQDLNQANGALTNQNRWSSGGLTPGNHRVTFTHLSGTTIDIDAVEVRGAPTITPAPTSANPPVSTGTYDDLDSNIVFSGPWTRYAATSCYDGGANYSRLVGNTATLGFNGTGVELLYTKYIGTSGILRIEIDGVFVADLNQATGASAYQNRWVSSSLTAGDHTIIFTHLSGTYIEIDAIEVK